MKLVWISIYSLLIFASASAEAVAPSVFSCTFTARFKSVGTGDYVHKEGEETVDLSKTQPAGILAYWNVPDHFAVTIRRNFEFIKNGNQNTADGIRILIDPSLGGLSHSLSITSGVPGLTPLENKVQILGSDGFVAEEALVSCRLRN